MRVTSETKQTTRGLLLAAAAEEFGRVGFERTSIDAVSVAAGFAKGTVYNYFASKEALFLAVVEEAISQMVGAASASPAATVRERLRAALASFCAWAGEHDALARVLVRECLMGTPGLYARVIVAETPLVRELEGLVREGARTGEIRDDLPAELLALALAGLADLALAQHWASDGASPTLEQIPELVVQALLGPRPLGQR